ncbi:MAG: tetratricopeptide repeat protein [Roseibium sp.]|nr:tetratricopeptide repeat protein [Roseibium sp.]
MPHRTYPFAARGLYLVAAMVFCALMWSAPGSAQDRDKDALFAALKSASSEMEARRIEARIWEGWIGAAPTAETEAMVREAMSKRRVADYDSALNLLNTAIDQAPAYAEARNQRAFIYYLQGRKDKSLEAIEETLRLEPRHFGALSGKARILLEQGRVRLGQKVLRAALEIHPYLPERFLLLRPKKPDGIDL